MGTSVQRALIATLLAAGVFYAPLVYADEDTSTSTPETTQSSPDESASSTEPILELFSATEAAEESASSTEEAADPLPAGVLLDRSYADTDWNIQIYGGGHYMYFFEGYESLGNPPVTQGHAWVAPNDIYKARIKTTPGTSCDEFRWGGTYGLSVWTEGFSTSYDSNPWYTRSVGDGLCEFAFYQAIPAGTRISAVSVGLSIQASIVGSAENAGTSTTGFYGDPVRGGFAFQLCGSDGCSGGFGSSTPPGPKISNVLFLPGIKGSRLYDDENRCGILLCDNRLWDPLSDSDIYSLYLDSAGKSKKNDVYTRAGDIVDKVDKKYYDSFINEMNLLQASSTFNGGKFRWKAASYDWRLSLYDLTHNGVERDGKIYYEEASDTPYIEQTLRELAQTSETGKVTIIAHSNGGLVTKALLQKLGNAETAALVDKIIFVGVPQSGAPQALGGLLFGDREGLPNDLLPIFVSRGVARGLAENSPMAYHLLPTQRYLADVQDPKHSVIGFSGTHSYQAERNAYGPSIDTVNELNQYLLAQEHGRNKPEFNDAASPNVLNPSLIEYANNTHAQIDTWSPPEGVELYQLAGWGVDTISGIDFYDEQKILGVTVGYKRQYRPIFVEDGDGVVPVPSALMLPQGQSIHDFWINFLKLREVSGKKYDHGTMLEVPDVLSGIVNVLTDRDLGSVFITSSKPMNTEPQKKLLFILHSPLTLGIYDSMGNYTGLKTDGTLDEGVPSAEYGEFGDVKYIIASTNQDYELVLHGESEGFFSLDVIERTNGSTTAYTTFANIPTTKQTSVSLAVRGGVNGLSDLLIDQDGDSDTDIEIEPQLGTTTVYQVISPETYSRNTKHISSQVDFEKIRPEILAPTSIFEAPAIKHSIISKERDQKQTYNENTYSSPEDLPIIQTRPTQTASVYDSLAFVSEWLSSLLYNIVRWLHSLNTNLSILFYG